MCMKNPWISQQGCLNNFVPVNFGVARITPYIVSQVVLLLIVQFPLLNNSPSVHRLYLRIVTMIPLLMVARLYRRRELARRELAQDPEVSIEVKKGTSNGTGCKRFCIWQVVQMTAQMRASAAFMLTEAAAASIGRRGRRIHSPGSKYQNRPSCIQSTPSRQYTPDCPIILHSKTCIAFDSVLTMLEHLRLFQNYLRLFQNYLCLFQNYLITIRCGRTGFSINGPTRFISVTECSCRSKKSNASTTRGTHSQKGSASRVAVTIAWRYPSPGSRRKMGSPVCRPGWPTIHRAVLATRLRNGAASKAISTNF